MPASIEDVARLANVSISTVSRVINRRALVNEETCKRVEAAIQQLSYRANAQAREMGHNLLISSAMPGDDAESWLSAIGQHALVDGLAMMVSDTMVAGVGPTLA